MKKQMDVPALGIEPPCWRLFARDRDSLRGTLIGLAISSVQGSPS